MVSSFSAGSRKLTAGFIVAVLILLFIGALSYRSILVSERDSAWVTHSHRVLEQLQHVMVLMLNAETGRRGYLLTRDESFLLPYRTAVSTIDTQLAILTDLTSDNPDVQRDIPALSSLIARRMYLLARSIDLAQTDPGNTQNQRTMEGKAVMDTLRIVLDRIEGTMRTILIRRNAESTASKQTMRAALLLGNIVALTVLLLVGFLMLRENATRREAEISLRILNRDLTEAKAKAESADQMKSAFLASMSHELRTPLNSILGFTGIILQGMSGPITDEQRTQLGMVQSSGRHLLTLINDVLDIAKIESGQLVVDHAPFNLRSSIEKAFHIVRPLAEKKSLPVDLRIDPAVGSIVGDARRVEQVVINLLSNAVKFTDTGNVTLTCYLQNGEAVIRVSDTGVGIKPDELSKLFQPFVQSESGLNRSREGTGLGLSISKKIVELLGGTIRLESTWGVGSIATVRLPLSSGTTHE